MKNCQQCGKVSTRELILHFQVVVKEDFSPTFHVESTRALLKLLLGQSTFNVERIFSRTWMPDVGFVPIFFHLSLLS